MSKKAGRGRADPDDEPISVEEARAAVAELLESGDTSWLKDVSINGIVLRN